ncbi:hypothetical protein [Caulobacter sp. B11]|uniref:hypothetical protein n=1 Tax=Caulobacter sp. B11 TaxID=2048899 RepID=UPI003517A8AF
MAWGGPGLGLACLVKALVELHGGWVALESEPAPDRPSPATCPRPSIPRHAA